MNKELHEKIIELLQQLTDTHQNDGKDLAEGDPHRIVPEQQTKKNCSESFLFEHPFFELPRRQMYSRYVIARCRTCGAYMRGNKMLSIFVKHLKIAHPDKYELYLNWGKEPTHEFKRPIDVRMSETSTNEDVIIIDDDIKDEQLSFYDDASSMTSDMTVDGSTSKFISQILDQKIIPVLEENRKLKRIAEKVDILQEDLKRTKVENRLLEQELQSLQRLANDKSILIREISCDETIMTPEQVGYNILHYVMGLTDIQFEKVVALPNLQNNSNKRSIIVTFQDKTSAKRVLSQAHKLKSIGIFMEPVITQNGLKRKNKLMRLRGEIKRLKFGISVYVSGTNLHVGGYIFEWNTLNYLSLVNKHMSTKTPIECLNEATGLNLRMFVQNLENENNTD